jgi:hypothetical protein
MRHSNTNRGSCNRAHRGPKPHSKINYSAVNSAAQANAAELCRLLLPDGRRSGREYEALNPKRDDRSVGSFRINLEKGKWADFATGDTGGDFVSLVAYLLDLRQSEAALHLAAMLNVSVGGRL